MKKLTIICVAIAMLTHAFGQNCWKGGTPGAESEWNNPRNWSMNKVPDWTRHVVIPDVSSESRVFPVIDSEAATIPSLEIQGGAKLAIRKNGQLDIDGSSTYRVGVFNLGSLENEGYLSVHDTALQPFDSRKGSLQNRGVFVIEGVLYGGNGNNLTAAARGH